MLLMQIGDDKVINKERLINKFFEYVKIDSESFNENEMAQTLIKEMNVW